MGTEASKPGSIWLGTLWALLDSKASKLLDSKAYVVAQMVASSQRLVGHMAGFRHYDGAARVSRSGRNIMENSFTRSVGP